MQRRSFLKNSIYAAVAVATSSSRALADAERKRIHVLGGTHFLGPAVVQAALADGHTVTLFNRGVSSPELFPYVEKLRGFRSANSDDQNLSSLGKRHWDAVIDVWPNDPALAESAARLLKDRTNHYLYVSSIGAYDEKDFTQPNLTEEAPLFQWVGSGSSYGRGKAESERRLHDIVGERLTIVRPGPIKGFRDTTPDLLGWLRRLQSGKPVIAPGDGVDPVEIVDVKDVADFLLLAIDHAVYGTFNLTGKPMSFGSFSRDASLLRILTPSWCGFQRLSCVSGALLHRTLQIGYSTSPTGTLSAIGHKLGANQQPEGVRGGLGN